MSKYVCKKCGSGDISYQVWVDEDGNNKHTSYNDWQIEYARHGQAWCEGEDCCGEIFGVQEIKAHIESDLQYAERGSKELENEDNIL